MSEDKEKEAGGAVIRMNQDETNTLIDNNTVYEICEFNDECDRCGNPNHKQSWAKMSGFPAEVDYYICEECVLKEMEKRQVTDKHVIM